MKKIVILTFCSLIAFTVISQDYKADVKTPQGSNVAAWITEESSIQTRTYWDASVAGSYPNAQQIKTYDDFSSSRRFNCHGYAWHMSELSNPLSEPRWIGYETNNTDEYIYWQDGSYVEVSQEVYPGKVSWASGDHSAITTSEKGWFISKWNEYPLLKHRWDDSPYGTTNLKYYKKAPPPYSISGPSTICDQATYTVENLPTDATVQWGATGSAQLVAGQGTGVATFSKTGNGAATIKATINGAVALEKEVWVGKPLLYVRAGDTPVNMQHPFSASILLCYRDPINYPDNQVFFEPQGLSNDFNETWLYDSPSSNPFTVYGGGYKATVKPNKAGYGFFTVKVNNECGCSLPAFIAVNTDNCNREHYYFLSPNGDGLNDTWEVGVIKSMGKETEGFRSAANIPVYNVAIFNSQGAMVYQKDNYMQDRERFSGIGNVGSYLGKFLPNGNYFFTIKGSVTESGSLYIKRE